MPRNAKKQNFKRFSSSCWHKWHKDLTQEFKLLPWATRQCPDPPDPADLPDPACHKSSDRSPAKHITTYNSIQFNTIQYNSHNIFTKVFNKVQRSNQRSLGSLFRWFRDSPVHLVWAARVGCSKWGNRCGLLGRRTKMAILDSKMAVICQLDPISNMIQLVSVSVSACLPIPVPIDTGWDGMTFDDTWWYLILGPSWPMAGNPAMLSRLAKGGQIHEN